MFHSFLIISFIKAISMPNVYCKNSSANHVRFPPGSVDAFLVSAHNPTSLRGSALYFRVEVEVSQKASAGTRLLAQFKVHLQHAVFS